MGGLAIMALLLAEQRSAAKDPRLAGFHTVHKIPPNDRKIVNPAIHPFSAEYYRIIDSITRGEKP